MRKCILFVILGMFVICFSCKKTAVSDSFFPVWDSTLIIERNIANRAISFQTNNEFSFLDEIAEKSQIIILGERTHYDMKTSETKINMINYLMSKRFNSIALEGAPFLTSYLFSNSEYTKFTKEWKIEEFWYPLWIMQEKCKPLLDMINKREIRISGIDSHLGIYDVVSAKTILEKYADNKIPEIDWDRLENLYNRKYVTYGYPQNISLSIPEQYELMRTIDTISNYIWYLFWKRKDNVDVKALLQWIRNLNTGFSFVENNLSLDVNETKLIFRNRDSQMAENILWMVENFPKEKFTIWCANFHGAKDISQTTYSTESLLYFTFQSMGEGVHNKLGEKMYSLAFTSMDERVTDCGILEQEIANSTNNSPFAFIAFTFLRFADGYRDKEFDCAVIMKKRGKWLYVFDGIYYIRDQEVNKLNRWR